MESLAKRSVNENPGNPFRPLAAEGYAWALLDDVADRSTLSRAVVAKLLKAQTWIARADLRDALEVKGNSFAQACSHVSLNREGLLDFKTLGSESFLRLNPETFVRKRERMIGENLEPAIARTIALARLRHRNESLHPVLDRADEVFSHMQRCCRRSGFPVGQQVGFLMAALSGVRGFTPHTFNTLHSANLGAMRVMMDKFTHPPSPQLGDYHLADFFTRKEEERGVRYTATSALMEFLGGEEAVTDLKARVLDADGTFPLPIHRMSAEELHALGKTFMVDKEVNLPPPKDAPSLAMEKYQLDASKTYTITRESEQRCLNGGRACPYLGLRGTPLTVLTPQTDFRPYVSAILEKHQLPSDDPENVEMVQTFLSGPDGPAHGFAQFSEIIKDPFEEVLVGYQQGGSRAGITVVKATALVPLNG